MIYLLNIKKKDTKEKNIILEKGFNAFKTKNEWDMFLSIITSLFDNQHKDLHKFQENIYFYLYNDLKGIKKSKEYDDLIKNPQINEMFYKQALEFFKERNNKFTISENKYKNININR